MPSIGYRLQHAWNTFLNPDPTVTNSGISYGSRPDRLRLRLGNERSIISSIYTKIGVDVSSIPIRHVRLDQNDRYIENVQSGLANCLSLEANIDQTGRAFIQDVVMSMCDEGAVAIVPVDTTMNPKTGAFDVLSMRTGKIKAWGPDYVVINVYNEMTGLKEDITRPKRTVAIVENPFYSVMNELNSMLTRLIEKLNLMDAVDDRVGSGKLDLMIQLPFATKTTMQQARADARKAEIERQLDESPHGIAYIDAAEKVIQLNRPVENNMLARIEYLTKNLYGQLGITEEVFLGTADEATMLNYYNRTIEPILGAITDAMICKFLTKTARSQGQTLKYFRDPFRLMPLSQLGELGDTLTRNEIFSSNDMRAVLGVKPDKDPDSDKLRNKNLNEPAPQAPKESVPANQPQNGRSTTNGGQNKV